MAAITSKVGVCNMALGHVGNRGTVSNIDTPTTDKEITFALWYDITRQTLLKQMMPNFALARLIVSQKVAPPFGYAYAYEYPQRCLKMLGIGNTDCKGDTSYAVEKNLILTDTLFENGMPIRIVDDVTDVTAMSSEFIMTFSMELAKHIVSTLTQDPAKQKALLALIPSEQANLSSLNAQENPPVRRSKSRFRASRLFNVRDNAVKK